MMKKSVGSTLIMVLFISLVAFGIALGAMQLATTKVTKAVNDKYALQAFYAAEAGVQDAIDTLTENQATLSASTTANDLNLPSSPSNATLVEDAEYYIEIFPIDAENIIVDAIGVSHNARKKIRVKASLKTISSFDFGLLTKSFIDINTGKITYELDIHGNDGIQFNGNPDNYDTGHGSTATHSKLNYTPKNGSTDNYGFYRPSVEVPPVDFDYFLNDIYYDIDLNPGENLASNYTNAAADFDNNIMFDETYLKTYNSKIILPDPANKTAALPPVNKTFIAQHIKPWHYALALAAISTPIQTQSYSVIAFKPLLDSIITAKKTDKDNNGNGNGNNSGDDTSDESNTDTSTDTSNSNNGNSGGNSNNGGGNGLSVYIPAGDHSSSSGEKRVYFFDNADIGPLNIDLGGEVSNAIIVATGDVVFNGADHAGNGKQFLDFMIASGGDITHNGRLDTGCFYWLDGEFRQNGKSNLEGSRVMSQGTIRLNGAFALTYNEGLSDFGVLPEEFVITSWQEVEI